MDFIFDIFQEMLVLACKILTESVPMVVRNPTFYMGAKNCFVFKVPFNCGLEKCGRMTCLRNRDGYGRSLAFVFIGKLLVRIGSVFWLYTVIFGKCLFSIFCYILFFEVTLATFTYYGPLIIFLNCWLNNV
jgi:hypothetical protein